MPAHAPVILFTYVGSPYAKKIEYVLACKKIPYTSCKVDRLANGRKMFRDIGITHRRVPVLAIGSDLYFDSNFICAKLDELYPETDLKSDSVSGLTSSAFIDGQVFGNFVKIANFAAAGEEFVKDRAQTFARALTKESRAASEAAFLAAIASLEKLATKRRFLDGSDKLSVLDITTVAIMILVGGSQRHILSPPPFDKAPPGSPCPNLAAYLKRMFAYLDSAEKAQQGQITKVKETDIPALLSKFQPQDLPAASKNSDKNLPIGSKVALKANDSQVVSQIGELVYADPSVAAIEFQRADDKSKKLRVWAPRAAYTVTSEQERDSKM